MKHTETLTKVYYKIEEFMNHGMQYIVWYKTLNFYTGCTEDSRAFITRDKQEAIQKQDELFNRLSNQ